ncbi:MAG: polyprenol monophosphomannose synthase [Gemmataceae bacterium]
MKETGIPFKILTFMATYNERENLISLTDQIHQALPQTDILVVDDDSPDGTGKVADQRAANDTRWHVIHRPGKLGLGTAMLEGLQFAIEQKYDYVITMDADFSHHPKYLLDLLRGMSTVDVMIGSRYVPGGGTKNWPLSRKVISRCVNTLVRTLMRIPARDTSGGFRCYRVPWLREANLPEMISNGYSVQEEILFRCHQAGCRIGETPIVFENRTAGASKVNLYEMIRSLSVLLYLGLGTMFGPAKKQTIASRKNPVTRS